MDLAAGTKLGPYEILAPIGAGGMGEVYRAGDTRLGRTVAIKVLPSTIRDHPELRKRLEREARTLSNLSILTFVIFMTSGSRKVCTSW